MSPKISGGSASVFIVTYIYTLFPLILLKVYKEFFRGYMTFEEFTTLMANRIYTSVLLCFLKNFKVGHFRCKYMCAKRLTQFCYQCDSAFGHLRVITDISPTISLLFSKSIFEIPTISLCLQRHARSSTPVA